jgi:hypothetical protein
MTGAGARPRCANPCGVVLVLVPVLVLVLVRAGDA